MFTLLLRPPPRNPGGGGLLVPPLGLAYLAASLQRRGLSVTLLDAQGLGFSWEETEKQVRRLRPSVLGLGTMTPVRDVAYAAAHRLRPYVDWIVLGGPHPTATGKTALNDCDALDFLVRGEGEVALPMLIDLLQQKQHPRISGIVSRDWDGGLAPSSNPDDLPFPARQLLPNQNYRYPLATAHPITTLITSRGCPFRCTFCDQSVTGRRWRARTPESVVSEMRQLEASGFRYVCIYDDNFTLDKRRVVDICESLLKHQVGIKWKCEARVDGVEKQLLKLMARAGCQTIAYGLETANQVGLDALKKESTPEDARRALRWTHAAGIESMAYILLGIPGESPELVRNTLDFCEEERVSYVQFSTLSAVPGTALYDLAMEQGWLTGSSVKGPFDDDLQRATVIADGWTEQSLQAMVREAYTRFYLKPGFVLRHGLRTWRHGQLRRQLQEGIAMARRRAFSVSTREVQ